MPGWEAKLPELGLSPAVTGDAEEKDSHSLGLCQPWALQWGTLLEDSETLS